MKWLLLCVWMVSSGMALSQTTRVRPKSPDSDVPVKEVKVKEKDRVFVSEPKPESEVDLGRVTLTDLHGNLVKPGLDKVTIIELWSIKGNETNLYWNKARELENKYAGVEELQIISINHDEVLSGKRLRKAVRDYLKTVSAPKTVYIDPLAGFRDAFRVPGQVSYMLVDHRNQYTNVGRGDDPDTIKLFDEHLINALKHQRLAQKAKEREEQERAMQN